MKVFVLVVANCCDYEHSVRCSVFKSLDDAQSTLQDEKSDLLNDISDEIDSYEFDESELHFEAWESDDISRNHYLISITEEEL